MCKQYRNHSRRAEEQAPRRFRISTKQVIRLIASMQGTSTLPHIKDETSRHMPSMYREMKRTLIVPVRTLARDLGQA